MVRAAALVSGGGTNLQALLDAEKSGIIHSGRISLVVSNKPQAYALTRAQQAGVETAVMPYALGEDRESYTQSLVRLLREKQIDMCLYGYSDTMWPLPR